jgi:hypothetical protein
MIKSATVYVQVCQLRLARARVLCAVADMAEIEEVSDSSLSPRSLPGGSLPYVCHGSLPKSANSATLPRSRYRAADFRAVRVADIAAEASAEPRR